MGFLGAYVKLIAKIQSNTLGIKYFINTLSNIFKKNRDVWNPILNSDEIKALEFIMPEFYERKEIA